MGSGSFPRTVDFQTAIAGSETLRLEVDGVVVTQVTVQVVSGSIVANPTTIVLGANSNLTVTVMNLEIRGRAGGFCGRRTATCSTLSVAAGRSSARSMRSFVVSILSRLKRMAWP